MIAYAAVVHTMNIERTELDWRAGVLGERTWLTTGSRQWSSPDVTGDGANDIPMLRAATWGMAYRAKPKAREAADGWIDRGDLTAILELFEIPESEWVTG